MNLEPDGGNLYRPHVMQIHSGRFWRCKHGKTGFKNWPNWEGCEECAKDDPEAYAKWHADQIGDTLWKELKCQW